MGQPGKEIGGPCGPWVGRERWLTRRVRAGTHALATGSSPGTRPRAGRSSELNPEIVSHFAGFFRRRAHRTGFLAVRHERAEYARPMPAPERSAPG